jgi:hypothetical protein
MSYKNANYSVPQPNNSTFVKNFHQGQPTPLFTIKQYTYNNKTEQVITPASVATTISNLYINGTIYAGDFVTTTPQVTPSDRKLKDNIVELSSELSENIMKLKPCQFTYKTDSTNHTHYGFIAQEVAEELPNLVITKNILNQGEVLTVNYLEIIPLLVDKIQKMQQEIDELKKHIQK